MTSILLQNPFPPQLTPAQDPPPPTPTVPEPAGAQNSAMGGNATSFGRSGNRPHRPTPASIFDAQTADDEWPKRLGPDLPKVAMPNPIPTSPLMLRLSEE